MMRCRRSTMAITATAVYTLNGAFRSCIVPPHEKENSYQCSERGNGTRPGRCRPAAEDFSFRNAGTLGLAILVTGMMAQRAFPAVEPAKLRVLILSGLNNHDWRSTTPLIKTM